MAIVSVVITSGSYKTMGSILWNENPTQRKGLIVIHVAFIFPP